MLRNFAANWWSYSRSVYRQWTLLTTCCFAVANVVTAQHGTPPMEWVGPDRFGGRTRALVVVAQASGSPALLAGSVGGGLWRSKDAGASWERVSDLGHQTVTSIAIDPSNPKILYAGTGEVDQGLSGVGLFRSEDGGESWHHHIETKHRQELAFIRRVSVSADGKEILAATSEGLYLSATPSSAIPDFSFKCVLPMRGCSEAMSDVAFHPTDKDKAVAASAETGAVFYRKKHPPMTGSLEWYSSKAANEPDPHTETWRVWNGSVSLAYAKANPNIVYASVDQSSLGRPIWRSDDGGEIFKPRDVTLTPCVTHLKPAVQTDVWASLIWAGHPQDPDFLILGRVDLWRSTDGGTSLTLLSDYEKHPDSLHADQHVLATRPDFGVGSGHSFQAWVGTDGGVFHTLDVTTADKPCEAVAWTRRNRGYSAAEFYSGIALGDGTLLTGTQDLGLLRRKPVDTCGVGNACWSEGRIKKGTAATTPVRDDIHKVLAHPSNASTAFALGSYFDVLRTTDSGNTWEYISNNLWNGTGWVRRSGADWEVESEEGLGVAALAIDSYSPPFLYLAGGCLYRGDLSVNPRPTWNRVQAPLRKRHCNTEPYVVAMAVVPNNPNDVWICYADGRVFRTTTAHDDPPTWHGVRGGPEARRYRGCQSLEITPAVTAPSVTALITFDGRDRPNVYQVEKMGGTDTRYLWTPLRLPEDARPYQAIAHPTNPSRVFVTTEIGVFEGPPGGNLQPLPGIPAVWTQTLFWHKQDLYVGTYGAGMYVVRSP